MMNTLIAFVSGFIVCSAVVFLPHSRASKNSLDSFKDFQATLSSLPEIKTKKHSVNSK